MKFRFEIIPSKCTGCRSCELACAFRHGKNQKPAKSRIYPIAHAPDKYVPVTCLQCDEAACMKSCLFDAISRNEETGAMDIDHERCVKCGASAHAKACPAPGNPLHMAAGRPLLEGLPFLLRAGACKLVASAGRPATWAPPFCSGRGPHKSAAHRSARARSDT